LPQEPLQTAARFMETEAKVPLNALYKAYHVPGRFAEDYYTVDLMSDVLGRGKSARMYQKLLKERKLFTNINAYNTSSVDPGLFVVQGNLNAGVTFEEADAAVEEVLQELVEIMLPEMELLKVKNQAESTLAFSEIELLNRAMNLAYAASAGNPDLVNKEAEKIQAVTVEDIQNMAKRVLRKENSSTLYYRAIQ